MISDCCGSGEADPKNGVKGDQSGKEYQIRSWYDCKWTCVLRHPDKNIRQLIYENAVAAALNDNIGYGQSDRQTFWNELSKVNYDASKITTPCNADCSSSTCAICKAAGFLSGNTLLQDLPITSTHFMQNYFVTAGFEVLTDTKYLRTKEYLIRGDVLLNTTVHTTIYIGEGNYDEASKVALSSSYNSGALSMFLSQFEPGNAIVREFCYLDIPKDKDKKKSKDNEDEDESEEIKRTTTKSPFRLSIINYAPMVQDIAVSQGMQISGIYTSSLSYSGNASTENFSGNQKIIMDYLLAKGLNAAAVCGIAANISQESGFSPASVGDGGTSFGLCQWHYGRGDSMKAMAGPNWDSNVTGQCDYLWHELNTGYIAVLNHLRSVPNSVEGARSAAEYFTRHFEIPGDPDYASNKSKATAESYFNLFVFKSSNIDSVAKEKPNVDDSFFSGSAMIGNSLVGGMKVFSGLDTLEYFYQNGISVSGVLKSSLLTNLCSKSWDKIYIELGINEISLGVETFISQYTELIDTIKSKQSKSKIYIISVLPVTKAKSDEGAFTMTRVNNYNEALMELASEKRCSYLDVCSALIDTSGYLPASESTDGVHFQPGVYKKWASYLRTHY